MGCVHHGHCEHELLHVGKTSKNFPENTDSRVEDSQKDFVSATCMPNYFL